MTELEYLETLTGEPWTGLRFEDHTQGRTTRFERLCAAVGRSFDEEVVLDCGDLTCVEAPRNLGRDLDDEALAQCVVEQTGMPAAHAARILTEMPHFEGPVRFICLGRIPAPDVLLAYLSPESAMKLVRRWQLVCGRTLQTTLSSFMSVCSTVAAAGSQSRLAFSFGCGDARQHGGLGADRIVVALPTLLAHRLMPREATEASVAGRGASREGATAGDRTRGPRDEMTG